MKERKISTKEVAAMGLLTAIVVVLQLLGQFIRFGPFSISLVLVPIVVGASLYGPWAGAWLGFVFGVVVCLQPDTSFFMNYNAFGTILTCLLKGAAAGFCSGLVFKALEKVNTYAAVAVSAIVCPVVNSGLFFLFCLVFFIPQIATISGDMDPVLFTIVGMIGLNFIAEMVVNVVLSPVIVRLTKLGKGRVR
ncbi:MAG: ECF transporter S component [Oscillospiraceae bacterium]|nr:ECF transporter S component [Oscillospiraceae bacterium]